MKAEEFDQIIKDLIQKDCYALPPLNDEVIQEYCNELVKYPNIYNYAVVIRVYRGIQQIIAYSFEDSCQQHGINNPKPEIDTIAWISKTGLLSVYFRTDCGDKDCFKGCDGKYYFKGWIEGFPSLNLVSNPVFLDGLVSQGFSESTLFEIEREFNCHYTSATYKFYEEENLSCLKIMADLLGDDKAAIKHLLDSKNFDVLYLIYGMGCDCLSIYRKAMEIQYTPMDWMVWLHKMFKWEEAGVDLDIDILTEREKLLPLTKDNINKYLKSEEGQLLMDRTPEEFVVCLSNYIKNNLRGYIRKPYSFCSQQWLNEDDGTLSLVIQISEDCSIASGDGNNDFILPKEWYKYPSTITIREIVDKEDKIQHIGV